MERQAEINTALNGTSKEVKAVLSPLIDEVIFIEKNLEELKKLPFIAVNPKNTQQQRYTVAYKQYKELFQQYTGAVKILLGAVDDKAEGKDSPLQQYFKRRMDELEA